MSRFLRKCQADPISLIVSLPANSPELARAAIAGGAECLKVHIRVHHDASGTHFGTLEEEQDNLEAILTIAESLPVGIVAGAEQAATPEEMETLARMGFDFFDMFDYFMPAWMLQVTSMTRVVAVGPNWSLNQLRALQASGAEMLEAAIVPHEKYGEPLTVADLASYRAIVETFAAPVIVPSQKRIRPEEVPLLAGAGVKAVMIGTIVTGKEAEEIEEVTARFRRWIDDFRNNQSTKETFA